nr:DNA polymerase [Candidatus Cloacimonadota bacterium]
KSPVKRQYVPKRSGHVLVQVDYSQAEFRTMVWLAQEDSLREVFNDPSRDVFTELCIMMFPGFTELNQKQRVEIRTLIKTFAYGIMYGRTPHGIAADPKFGMTVSEAEQHYLLFKKQIPNIIEFQESVVARVERGEELETPFGRRKRFYLIAPMNRSDVHNEAMAFMPQSIASDLCIAGGIESQQEFNRANALGQASAHIINIVHDALYAEVAVSDVEWAVSVMNKAMVGAAEKVTGGYVDFATDAEVGPSWGELVKLKVWYEQRR